MGHIFRAAAVVTCNSSHEVFEDGFLAIRDDRILDVGPWAKRPRSRSFEIKDCGPSLITPGLFNLHTHLPMTWLRGMGEDIELEKWLFDVIVPLESKWLDRDLVRVAAESGLCESIRNGVTFLGDMYYFEDEVAKVVDRLGVRALLGCHVWDQKAPDARTPAEALEGIQKLARKFQDHERIMVGVAPHTPYTCSESLLKDCAQLASELNIPTILHLAETKWEFAEIMEKYRLSPTHFIARTGLLEAKRVLLAHAVWLKEDDMSLLAKPNISVVLNPQCNAKLGSGVAAVQRLLQKKVRVTLGTDGPASNNSLDLFLEMNFLSKIHHVTTLDLTGLPGASVFDMVTRAAASAMGLEEQIGSLEPQKQADFIIINANTPALTPLTNPYSYLIYSVMGRDVETVYVAGKCLMRNKKILVSDEAKVLRAMRQYWNKIKKSLSSPRRS